MFTRWIMTMGVDHMRWLELYHRAQMAVLQIQVQSGRRTMMQQTLSAAA